MLLLWWVRRYDIDSGEWDMRIYSLLFILVEKREGERGEVWHLGGGYGLPETREEQCRPLPPQAQLDVPSCLPQIPKEKKVEKFY